MLKFSANLAVGGKVPWVCVGMRAVVRCISILYAGSLGMLGDAFGFPLLLHLGARFLGDAWRCLQFSAAFAFRSKVPW